MAVAFRARSLPLHSSPRVVDHRRHRPGTHAPAAPRAASSRAAECTASPTQRPSRRSSTLPPPPAHRRHRARVLGHLARRGADRPRQGRPALAECEVRVVAHDACPRPSGRAPAAGPGTAEPRDEAGAARHPARARVRIAEGIEVLVDGDPARWSTCRCSAPRCWRPSRSSPTSACASSFADARGVVRCLARWPGRRSRCRRTCRPATAPASSSTARTPRRSACSAKNTEAVADRDR